MSIAPRVLAGPGAVPRLLLDQVSCRLCAPIPAEAEHTAAQWERPPASGDERTQEGRGEGGPWDAGGGRVTCDALGGVSRATLCGCLSL